MDRTIQSGAIRHPRATDPLSSMPETNLRHNRRTDEPMIDTVASRSGVEKPAPRPPRMLARPSGSMPSTRPQRTRNAGRGGVGDAVLGAGWGDYADNTMQHETTPRRALLSSSLVADEARCSACKQHMQSDWIAASDIVTGEWTIL